MKTLKKAPKLPALKLPPMAAVKSGNILAIGYDAAAGALHVTFKGGGHYSYSGVPRSLHDEMLCAESIGGFFHSRIKSNKDFKHAKIEIKKTEKKEEHRDGDADSTSKG